MRAPVATVAITPVLNAAGLVWSAPALVRAHPWRDSMLVDTTPEKGGLQARRLGSLRAQVAAPLLGREAP